MSENKNRNFVKNMLVHRHGKINKIKKTNTIIEIFLIYKINVQKLILAFGKTC